MIRWFLNRFRKKEKRRLVKFRPPSAFDSQDFGAHFRLYGDKVTQRDSATNHIYEEIEDPNRLKKHKKRDKKVHFLDTKFHSVGDISQVARDSPILSHNRRSSSLVEMDATTCSDHPGSNDAIRKPEPVKPPRKSRTATRRWHTMLEKSDTRPLLMTQRDSSDPGKPDRFRFVYPRHGDNYCVEHADSDSGYENSNCSSNDGDIVDSQKLTGYTYYLTKIEQLRMLEEEVDDLMEDLQLDNVSEAHKLLDSRIGSPRFLRKCLRSPESKHRGLEKELARYTKLPDPDQYPPLWNSNNSRSCDSLTRNFTFSHTNTPETLLRDSYMNQKLGNGKLRNDVGIWRHSGTPRGDRGDVTTHLESSLSQFSGYRKSPSTSFLSRHHTVAEADVTSRSTLSNKTLRDLIRNNYHRQNFVAKM